MVYGEEPEIIDHINGDRADNRLVNLRSVTAAQNTLNRAPNFDKALPKGVTLTPCGTYLAKISFEHKHYNLGHWETIAEAKAAYYASSKILHNEYARKNDDSTVGNRLGDEAVSINKGDGYDI